MKITVVCCVSDVPERTVRLGTFNVHDDGSINYSTRLDRESGSGPGEIVTSEHPSHVRAVVLDRSTDLPIDYRQAAHDAIAEFGESVRERPLREFLPPTRTVYLLDCPRCKRTYTIRAERLRVALRAAATAGVSELPIGGLC